MRTYEVELLKDGRRRTVTVHDPVELSQDQFYRDEGAHELVIVGDGTIDDQPVLLCRIADGRHAGKHVIMFEDEVEADVPDEAIQPFAGDER